MKPALLKVAALGEAATGLALLVYPPTVVRLLCGADIAGAGIVMSRTAGIALIALGIACWPGPPLAGMLTYSAVVTLYMTYVGVSGGAGILLWPAVAVHAVLLILLVRAFRKEEPDKERKT